MRTVKDAELRRNEILSAAEQLFASSGFDATSMADIQARVGIARGTLYYHFKSKEEILDGVIKRITDAMLLDAARIVEDRSIPLLHRLTKSLLALHVSSPVGMELLEQIHKPQNALMHQKIMDRTVETVVPTLTPLVVEGVEQGIFHTDYPYQVIETCIIYTNIAFDDRMAALSPEERNLRVEAFICNTERMLGTEPGVLRNALTAVFDETNPV